MIATTKDAYELVHNGSIALANAEAAGMRIDVDLLKSTIEANKRKVLELEEDLFKEPEYRSWNAAYAGKTNLGSGEQFGYVLFEILGIPCKYFTPTGRPKTDAESLEEVDHPFAKKVQKINKLRHVTATTLKGLLRGTVDGFFHPNFNLHSARTHRSSSGKDREDSRSDRDFNIQNIPGRDSDKAKMVRRCFIARENHYLIENDFKSIEVGCAACYTKDPVLIEYLENAPPVGNSDMHRDMAQKIFCIEDPKAVPKEVRYIAKNCFVFPEFYGSYYIQCARNIWKACELKKAMIGGMDFKDWLRSKGITKLGNLDPKQEPLKGSFEAHLKKIEDWYWNKKYKVYTSWKEEWYAAYEKKGLIETFTGFIIEGLLSYNQVLNYPIQSTAFHFLLWTMTKLNSWMIKNNMRSRIIGQVHDSILGDIHKDEKDYYLEKIQNLVTVKLPKHWNWINVPMSIETELCPLGGNWYQKESV